MKKVAVVNAEQAQWAQEATRLVVDAMEQAIQGKRRVLELVFTAAVAGGHVLLEDVPGTGKTALARALAASMHGTASRIQFTPDLLPGDVTGMTVYEQNSGELHFHPGPVFANVVLADEINRASPKTQSALLEVMEEKQVTVDGKTREVPEPFMVIATQNPVEQVGTYQLPEAQLDRFMLKTAIGYPDNAAMLHILQGSGPAKDTVPAVMQTETLMQMRGFAAAVTLNPTIANYITAIVEATRRAAEVRLGASVRGAIALAGLSKAWALVHGRNYVLPDDVRELATGVLAHRLVLLPEAEFDGVTAEAVIGQVLQDVPVPVENGTL